MKAIVVQLKEVVKDQSFWTPFLIVLFTLPVSVRALECFFSFDDLMNLDYYLARPLQSIFSNFILFTSFHRPLGSIFYIPLYTLFGLQPLPFYLLGVLLFTFNVILFYSLVFHITQRRVTALIAATLVGLHPEVHNVLYNFGAVFELSLFTLVTGSLFAYSKYRKSKTRESVFYFLSLFCFVGALNAKETAVVTPFLLFSYEWIYFASSGLNKSVLIGTLRRTLPFFVIAVPYSVVKLIGTEAYWKENPQYYYSFDATIAQHLADYLTLLINSELIFDWASAFVVLLVFIGSAWLLKNRHMFFGIVLGVLALGPVLPLPRVWGLFLYLPLAGFSLAVASGIGDVGVRICLVFTNRVWPGFRKLLKLSRASLFRLALTLAFLAWIEPALSPSIHKARHLHYQNELSAAWKSFSSQLYALHPSFPPGTSLAFESPPFDFKFHYRWCLNFLVWLKYEDHSIRIYRIPEQEQEFSRHLETEDPAFVFTWKNNTLEEATVGD